MANKGTHGIAIKVRVFLWPNFRAEKMAAEKMAAENPIY